MKKGVQLPVNALIILALALIVLVASVALFTGVYQPGKDTTEGVGSFNSVCGQYVAAGCCEGDTAPSSCTTSDDGESLQSQLEKAASGIDVPASSARDQCCNSE